MLGEVCEIKIEVHPVVPGKSASPGYDSRHEGCVCRTLGQGGQGIGGGEERRGAGLGMLPIASDMAAGRKGRVVRRK